MKNKKARYRDLLDSGLGGAQKDCGKLQLLGGSSVGWGEGNAAAFMAKFAVLSQQIRVTAIQRPRFGGAEFPFGLVRFESD